MRSSTTSSQTESVRAAARDVWTVLTSLLAQSAVAGIFVGLVTVVANVVLGPRQTRDGGPQDGWRPLFRDHALIVHGTLAVRPA